MEFSNAQKLAAVVAEWSRPAISQIATSRLANIKALSSMQQTLISSGLVGANYNIATEIMPFVHSTVNTLVEPLLSGYFGKLPDETIPAIAHSVVDTAMQQPSFSVLGGLVEFSQDDMIELKDLLDKNLPLGASKEIYNVIK